GREGRARITDGLLTQAIAFLPDVESGTGLVEVSALQGAAIFLYRHGNRLDQGAHVLEQVKPIACPHPFGANLDPLAPPIPESRPGVGGSQRALGVLVAR